MRQGHRTLILLLLLAASCRDAYHLATLQGALSREFHDAGIGVSLTDGLILTVTFVNGPSTDAPCDSQAALAYRVADFVRHNYQGFDSLWTVSIAFEHRGSGGPTTTTSTHIPFRFGRAALQTGLLAADSAGVVGVCEMDIRGSSSDPR